MAPVAPVLPDPIQALPAQRDQLQATNEQLEATFGDPNKATADAHRLVQLRQTGAASLYAAEFRRLALSLDWGDEALKFHFVGGLKEELKDELARRDPIDSLDALIEWAVTLDNRLYMRRLQRRDARAHAPFAPTSAPVSRSFTPCVNPTVSVQDRQQINSKRKLPRRGPLTQAEKDYRRQNNLCSFCGGAGHFAAACPVLAARKSSRGSAAVRTTATTAT